MNYEELFSSLSALEKDLKDSVKAADRLFKTAQKNTADGNMPELIKALSQLSEVSSQMGDRTGAVLKEAKAFDTKAYFVSGDFTRQLLDACEERGIDVKGEKGVYEMFPYKVRIYGDDEHAEEVWINRKKHPSVRPSAVADTIKAGQDKLRKAKFNESSFMKELSEAYDTTCMKEGLRAGSTLSLTKLYKTMTPMARARKEYDMQAFAFDLARVYEKGPEAWNSPDGRSFIFGTSRDGKSGIRVLSSAGTETYITTLRPLSAE